MLNLFLNSRSHITRKYQLMSFSESDKAVVKEITREIMSEVVISLEKAFKSKIEVHRLECPISKVRYLALGVALGGAAAGFGGALGLIKLMGVL